MAIQPIDLQTIFSQLDKVGRTQAALREGQQIQASLQQIETQKKLETDVQSVNEAQNMGEEANKIKEENKQNSNSGEDRFEGKQEDEETEAAPEKKLPLFRDPSIGRNIDISG